MPAFINTNIASLNAQRNLNGSQNALQTSLQRLSSGLRINSAKDDAAGMAISDRMTSQIRGNQQATRNANDGISLAQTTEGSMAEISNNLQRIRDLAVQARNATNSASDRTALNAEAHQLMAEIDRVATTTAFNGVKVLDGTFTGQAFQVGSNAGESVSINKIVNATSSALGSNTLATTTATSTTFAAIASGASGSINGVGLGAIGVAANAAERGAQVAAAANAISGQTGVLATVTAAGVVTFNNYGAVPATTGIVLLASTIATDTGLTAGTTAAGAATAGFAALDLTTAAGADSAITHMDNALTSINSARADMGALQNRFTSVVNNLQTTTENLTASRSRIQDTDFATETSQLTRAQILQQAGTAMLAQANAVPNGVMALLR